MGNFIGDLVGQPTHRPQLPDPSLSLPLAKIGIEIEVEGWDGQRINSSLWQDKEDHSLRGASREFVTSGRGLVGLEISKALEVFVDHAKSHGYTNGYPRAGIHVHLDVTDLDMESGQLASFVATYLLLEHVFFGYAGDWRNYCCYTVPMNLGQNDFASIGRALFDKNLPNHHVVDLLSRCSKYQALNLECITRYGTVEFRHLPTTFEYDRIFTWIRMILAVKAAALAQSGSLDPLSTLSRSGVHDFAIQVFGTDLYEKVAKYLDASEAWKAVDNAQLLMAHGNALGPTTSGSWEDISVEASEVLKTKAKKIEKYRASRTNGKKSTAQTREEDY